MNNLKFFIALRLAGTTMDDFQIFGEFILLIRKYSILGVRKYQRHYFKFNMPNLKYFARKSIF